MLWQVSLPASEGGCHPRVWPQIALCKSGAIRFDEAMIPHESGSSRNRETRRQFIKKTGTVAAAVAGAGLFNLPVSAGENNASVAIVLDAADAVGRPRRSDGRRNNCAKRWPPEM